MKWTATIVRNEHLRRFQVKVWSTDGSVEWPIQYSDGRIAYDHPEIVPLYAQKAVKKLFKLLGEFPTFRIYK